jgi:thioredoxin 1
MIQKINGKEQLDQAIQKGDCLVGFSAPWCGFCHRLMPIMQKISDEIEQPIYAVNIDENKDLADAYQVETIPNIFYFHNGRPIDSIIGYGNVGYPEMKAFIAKNEKK